MGRFLIWLIAALTILAAVWALTPPADAEERVDVALVFIVDVSGSVEESEKVKAREAHATALAARDVMTAIESGRHQKIAVAYVEFDSQADTLVEWMTIADIGDAEAFGSLILPEDREPPEPVYYPYLFPGGGPLSSNYLVAYRHAAELLATAPPAEKMVIDVVGDGEYSAPPIAARDALVAEGVVINMLAVGSSAADHAERSKAELIGGPAHFYMPLANRSQLPVALRSKIVLELY